MHNAKFEYTGETELFGADIVGLMSLPRLYQHWRVFHSFGERHKHCKMAPQIFNLFGMCTPLHEQGLPKIHTLPNYK